MGVHIGRTHPGGRGKSGVEKIRDALDDAYIVWYENRCESTAEAGHAECCADECANRAGVEGIALALAILRGTTQEHEIEEAESRYEE